MESCNTKELKQQGADIHADDDYTLNTSAQAKNFQLVVVFIVFLAWLHYTVNKIKILINSVFFKIKGYTNMIKNFICGIF